MLSSFKFLGVHISEDLSWTINTTAIFKKTQQRRYFLHTLRKVNLSHRHPYSFYRCSIESIPSWYGSSSAADRKTLQRAIKTAQHHQSTAGHLGHHLQLQMPAKTHSILPNLYLNCYPLENVTGPPEHTPKPSPYSTHH